MAGPFPDKWNNMLYWSDFKVFLNYSKKNKRNKKL